MNSSANFALRSRRVITNGDERAATVVVIVGHPMGSPY